MPKLQTVTSSLFPQQPATYKIIRQNFKFNLIFVKYKSVSVVIGHSSTDFLLIILCCLGIISYLRLKDINLYTIESQIILQFYHILLYSNSNEWRY
jgi:hypothetical protein